jgi:hypothetical protein
MAAPALTRILRLGWDFALVFAWQFLRSCQRRLHRDRVFDVVLCSHLFSRAVPAKVRAKLTAVDDGTVTTRDREFINFGTTLYYAGNIRFAGGHFFNMAGAAFLVMNDLVINRTFGNPTTFENDGIFAKTGGAGAADVRIGLNNRGAVGVDAGELWLGGPGLHTGLFSVPAGTVLDFYEAGLGPVVHTLSTGVTFVGTGWVRRSEKGILSIPNNVSVRIENFELKDDESALSGLGTFSAHFFKWSGGRMIDAGITRIDPNDTMLITGGLDKELFGRSIVTFGNIDWTDTGDIDTATNARIINDGQNGQGFFNILNNQTITTIEAVPTSKIIIQNNGVLQKVGGVLPTTIRIPVENKGGTVDTGGKHVRLEGGYNQTAGTTTVGTGNLVVTGALLAAGGMVELSGGSLTASMGLQVAQGAVLSGYGSIFGDVNNAGHILVGGLTTTGTLSITGFYQQVSTGTLDMKIGGTVSGMFDVLEINGSASLAGTLNITLFGGFAPAQGDSFMVLESTGQRSGTFDATNYPPLGDGLAWLTEYNDNNVTLLVQ